MSHGVPNRNWSYPTAIQFRVGRIAELAEHASAAGLKKPLLVTDKALAYLPITSEALDVLDKAGLGRAMFSDVDPNPNEKNMADGIAVYLKGGGKNSAMCLSSPRMTKSSSGRPLGENARMHLSTGSSQSSLPIEHGVNLRELNTFGLPATATHLVRITSDADVRRLLDHPRLGRLPKLVLGGGSNLVLTRDPPGVVMRVEVMGRRLVAEHDDAWVVELGAGESWHDCVRWTLEQGWPGLENLALIPGTAGAAPVQNIGAYGLELADRFDALDAVDLVTGRSVTLDARACAFGYRDSVFKHAGFGGQTI